MGAFPVFAPLERWCVMIKLTPEPLTAENFAPFGSVIEPDMARSFLINEDTTRRFHQLAEIDRHEDEGRSIISIFRAERRSLPLEIRMMEKHPLGAQAFLPAQAHKWLIVVADGERPKAKDCRVFIAEGCQGVQYNAGVWHHPLLIIEPTQNFWVIDRAGAGDNLEEIWFEGGNAIIDITENM